MSIHDKNNEFNDDNDNNDDDDDNDFNDKRCETKSRKHFICLQVFCKVKRT